MVVRHAFPVLANASKLQKCGTVVLRLLQADFEEAPEQLWCDVVDVGGTIAGMSSLGIF